MWGGGGGGGTIHVAQSTSLSEPTLKMSTFAHLTFSRRSNNFVCCKKGGNYSF